MRASHDITFKWRDHSWTSLPQEIGQLFPGSFQHRVVLDVAAQVIVVLLEEVEPGPPALHPLRAKKKSKQISTKLECAGQQQSSGAAQFSTLPNLSGSLHASSHPPPKKKSEKYNQADFDLKETYCACWWWWRNTKSQILGQSEQGAPNLNWTGKKGRGFKPLHRLLGQSSKSVIRNGNSTRNPNLQSFRRLVRNLVTWPFQILRCAITGNKYSKFHSHQDFPLVKSTG